MWLQSEGLDNELLGGVMRWLVFPRVSLANLGTQSDDLGAGQPHAAGSSWQGYLQALKQLSFELPNGFPILSHIKTLHCKVMFIVSACKHLSRNMIFPICNSI